jgi:hypothetical protein
MSRIWFLKKYTSLIKIRWFKVLDIVMSQIFSAVSNPNYVFFSIIALVLGTTGIWIEYFPHGLKGMEKFDIENSKLPVFTFCIATLGYLATESYFENQKNGDPEDELKRNFGVFSWCVCLFLTFYSYIGIDTLMLGFWSTITFWLLVNVDKRAFNKADKKAMENMDSNSSDAEAIDGPGL